MKLGLSSYSYGWAVGVPGSTPPSPMTAFDLLEACSAHGIHVLQIADNLPLHDVPAPVLRQLRQQAQQTHVQVELGTRGIEPEQLRTYLDLASDFGSPIVRTVIDTATHHPGEDEVVRTLKPLMPELESERVTLAIENHDRFPAQTLRRIMERLDSPSIGICLDTANSLGAQEGVRYVAETLAPWVVNLHVKDISIRRLPHLMGFIVEGRPAGQGDLDIPWLLQFVRTKVPRPVNAILELWPPPESTLDETLTKEAAWVESSVRYLRTLIPD